jgi:hypothetical protein
MLLKLSAAFFHLTTKLIRRESLDAAKYLYRGGGFLVTSGYEKCSGESSRKFAELISAGRKLLGRREKCFVRSQETDATQMLPHRRPRSENDIT